MVEINYNHNYPLSSFKEVIEIIKSKGFNLIAVSQIYLEDIFVFETEEESAYRTFERDKNEKWIGKVVGWWYSKKEFREEVGEYESKSNNNLRARVYWL